MARAPRRPTPEQLVALDDVAYAEAALLELQRDVAAARKSESHQAVVAGTRLALAMRERLELLRRGAAPPRVDPFDGVADAEVIEQLSLLVRSVPELVLERLEAAIAERRRGAHIM